MFTFSYIDICQSDAVVL